MFILMHQLWKCVYGHVSQMSAVSTSCTPCYTCHSPEASSELKSCFSSSPISSPIFLHFWVTHTPSQTIALECAVWRPALICSPAITEMVHPSDVKLSAFYLSTFLPFPFPCCLQAWVRPNYTMHPPLLPATMQQSADSTGVLREHRRAAGVRQQSARTANQ